MIETTEKPKPAFVGTSKNARELAFKAAQDKFKQFNDTLQAAIDKYKSTFAFRYHERKSQASGVDHPRVVDVKALQAILDNAEYSVSVKDAMLSYIDDREHFRGSKLSPLRRYIRNAIQSYIKLHNIESLELSDMILAMHLTSEIDEYKPKSEDDSDTQTVDEPKEDSTALRQELQRVHQQLLQTQQRFMHHTDQAQKMITAKDLAQQQVQEALEKAIIERDQALRDKQQLQLENDQQSPIALGASPQFKDAVQSIRQELGQVIDKLQTEKAETAALLKKTNGDREQLINENKQLRIENAEQARIIKEQSTTIKSLNAIIGELKASFEVVKKAAMDSIGSFYTMFSTMKQYFKQAVINKKPKQVANANIQTPESQYGEEFRKHVRKELAKDAGGTIHALYREERDPTTGQTYGEIATTFSAYLNEVDDKFEQAIQFNQETYECAPKLASENAPLQANLGDVPMAPPAPPAPPAPTNPIAGAPVSKPAITPKKPAKQPSPQSVVADKASASPVSLGEAAAAKAAARAKRLAEGGSPAVQPASPAPTVTKAPASPINIAEAAAAKAAARAKRLAAEPLPAVVTAPAAVAAPVDNSNPLAVAMLRQFGHFQDRRPQEREDNDLLARLKRIQHAVSDEEWEDGNESSNNLNK